MTPAFPTCWWMNKLESSMIGLYKLDLCGHSSVPMHISNPNIMANTSSSLDLQTSSKGQREYQAQLRCWIQNFVAVAVAETEEERLGKSTYQPKYSPYNVEFAGDAKAQEVYFMQQGSLKRDLDEHLSFNRLRHALAGLANLMDFRRTCSFFSRGTSKLEISRTD